MIDTTTQADVTALLARLVELAEAGQAEGLDAASAARLIGVSRSKFLAMDSAGHVPSRVELGDGRCPRWSRGELVAWLRAGAPTRVTWQQRRDLVMKGVR
ncbi:MAG TPA: hypothetical protein PLD59_04655 [Tepidisphaeraceae bacterium]|nr:hypothetical protein [Tepidisphaeraceae bacterium]